jgi:hypothetical protein
VTVVITFLMASGAVVLWWLVQLWARYVGVTDDMDIAGPLAAFLGMGLGLLMSTWGKE